MITGADSIDDLDALREGAVAKVLPGVKAPSTLDQLQPAVDRG